MRVALLGNYPIYPFAESLGIKYAPRNISTWLINLAKHLARADGVDVHVIAEEDQLPGDRVIVRDNITFHLLRCPRRFRATTLFFGDVRRIHRVLARVQPDVVNAHHTDEYALAAVRSQYPHVISVHGILSRFVPSDRLFCRAKIIAKVERYVLTHARNLIASSPFVYEAVGNGISARWFDVENCLDDAYFSDPEGAKACNELVFVGHLIKDKGVHYLVEAVAELAPEFPALHLTVVGSPSPWEPDYWRKLQALVVERQLGSRVTFTGILVDAEKIAVISRATILVHPSRLETFCMSVAEAMALGTPVVASNVGGLPFTVGGADNAVLVPYGDVRALAAALRELLKNDNRRRDLGERGRDEARRRFHPSVSAKAHLACFKEVIRGG